MKDVLRQDVWSLVIKIARTLDSFGISYIEEGCPGFNPKYDLFFEQMKKAPIKHAKLTAFDCAWRKDKKASEDKTLRAITKSSVKTACIFCKT